jgi:hypothetical protein
MIKINLLSVLGVLVSGPALAQGLPGPAQPGATGAVIQIQPNTTGNDRDVVIAPGRTGASTITTDSAAGGNASHPERAVPNGSANGGGSR